MNIRVQNKPNSEFNKRNIRQLFIDGSGTYNSGPVDPESAMCLVSGAFYRELDHEQVESNDELNELFKHVRNVSEKVGKYSVLRGLKELGVSVPTEFLEVQNVENVEMSETE